MEKYLNKFNMLISIGALFVSTAACDETPSGFWPTVDGAPPRTDGGPRFDGLPDPDTGRTPDAGPPPKDGAPPRKDGAVSKETGPRPDLPHHPALYSPSATHSPITPYVAKNLKAIAAKNPSAKNRVFSKIGNSITVSKQNLHCFAGSKVNLAGRSYLQPTITHFSTSLPGGTTSFDRTSQCATIGWSAWSALKGNPSPLQREISAVSPRFAVVMYGSNDIEGNNIFSYANNMLDVADTLIKNGVIPLMSTIPPRDDKPSSGALVPRYNAVVRGIAQARQVPLMNYHKLLMPLPRHGLAGDKLHPNVYWPSTGAAACDFSTTGLTYGYNVRNLLTLEALHRVRTATLGAGPAPDAPKTPLSGRGTAANPFVIPSLPFSDLRNTRTGGTKTIATYSGCRAAQDESGAEFFYRLKVSKTTNVRALVFDRGTVDIDLHLLGKTPTAAACIKRAHQELTATLQPGTYHLSLDTFVKGGTALSGEYLFLLLSE